MKNPTITILLFIPLTFTICYATSQIIHDAQYLVGCTANSTETQLAIDGDEAFYVDFQRREVVFTAPPLFGSLPTVFVLHDNILNNAEKNGEICRVLLAVITPTLNPPEEQDAPDSVLYPSEEVELGMKNRLICYVKHFYPPSIQVSRGGQKYSNQVSWTRNGEAVNHGASLSRYFPDEDGTFHQFSSLDFIPHEGDEYSCSVTHPALEKPTVRFWDSEPEQVVRPGSGVDVFCGVGLTLGTLAAAGGMFLIVKSGRV